MICFFLMCWWGVYRGGKFLFCLFLMLLYWFFIIYYNIIGFISMNR